MVLNLKLSNEQAAQEPTSAVIRPPRIVVMGIGGGGGNAVATMQREGLGGVELVCANTDAQALGATEGLRRLQLGAVLTKGFGTGSRPDIGAKAAEESADDIREILKGTDILFIAAGMGGGTGTGGAAVIARLARDLGILSISVVTRPFEFEGIIRERQAREGIALLAEETDALIVIPNQNILRIHKDATIEEGFRLVDGVLSQSVTSIAELITQPHMINLDFADIRTVMQRKKGTRAALGCGEGEGQYRGAEAAERAIYNPLLEENPILGATALLIQVAGGPDLSLADVDEAVTHIRQSVDPEAVIVVGGFSCNESLKGRIRATVIATGIPAVAERTAAARHLPAERTEALPQKAYPAAAAATAFDPAEAEAHDADAPTAAETTLRPEDEATALQKLKKLKARQKAATVEDLYEQERQQDLFADTYENRYDDEFDMQIPSFLVPRKRKTK